MSEDKQIKSECVLFSRHIIEKIFSNLNVKDLRRAAGVCWYWHEMAKKELSARSTVESLILPLYITPYNHGFCCAVGGEKGYLECYKEIQRGALPKPVDLTDANWHISEAVRCVPKIFLVFCDDNETKYPFCYEYMRLLPKSALFADMAFLKITVDGTELYAENNLCSGISIPSTSNLKCEMLNITEDDGYFDDKLDSMSCSAREILSKLNIRRTPDEHSCFILFLNRWLVSGGRLQNSIWKYESYVTEVLNKVKKRFKPGTYSVLGTGCTIISTSLNRNPWLDTNFTLFLRIHGSGLKSWSTVISLDLSVEEMKNELLDLKKKIHVNSSTIALCAVPVDEKILCRGIPNLDKKRPKVSYFDPSETFKQIFPSVTLTCLYDNHDYFQFGCNTLNNGK